MKGKLIILLHLFLLVVLPVKGQDHLAAYARDDQEFINDYLLAGLLDSTLVVGVFEQLTIKEMIGKSYRPFKSGKYLDLSMREQLYEKKHRLQIQKLYPVCSLKGSFEYKVFILYDVRPSTGRYKPFLPVGGSQWLLVLKKEFLNQDSVRSGWGQLAKSLDPKGEVLNEESIFQLYTNEKEEVLCLRWPGELPRRADLFHLINAEELEDVKMVFATLKDKDESALLGLAEGLLLRMKTSLGSDLIKALKQRLQDN